MNNALIEIAEIMKTEGCDRTTASQIYKQRKAEADKIGKVMEVKQIQIEENKKKYDYYPNPNEEFKIIRDTIYLIKEGRMVDAKGKIILLIPENQPFIKKIDLMIQLFEDLNKFNNNGFSDILNDLKKIKGGL